MVGTFCELNPLTYAARVIYFLLFYQISLVPPTGAGGSMVDLGRRRTTVADIGLPVSTMVDHGRSWLTMVRHAIPWSTHDHRQTGSTMIDHGRPWATMVVHG